MALAPSMRSFVFGLADGFASPRAIRRRSKTTLSSRAGDRDAGFMDPREPFHSDASAITSTGSTPLSPAITRTRLRHSASRVRRSGASGLGGGGGVVDPSANGNGNATADGKLSWALTGSEPDETSGFFGRPPFLPFSDCVRLHAACFSRSRSWRPFTSRPPLASTQQGLTPGHSRAIFEGVVRQILAMARTSAGMEPCSQAWHSRRR